MGKKKNYESPYIKRAQIETESAFCAASHTGKNVIDERNNKVEIVEQGHTGWESGSGNDIDATWQ